MIYYFDNAATSWPKPETVIKAVEEAIRHYSANPGRGGHQLSLQASRILFATRVQLAKLFNVQNPNDIAYMFNTSLALNQAIKGYLQPGMHVITTSVEHNSVRRPLEAVKTEKGIEVTYLRANPKGAITMSQIKQAIRPNTAMFICSHSSNLLGSILPLRDISVVLKSHGIKLLVDAAQSAGHVAIDVQTMGIDMMAFPGHKGLLGPQGTGGLYISPDIQLEPLVHGGTGSQSEWIEQPQVRPDRFETGTLNTTGIAGLNEGLKYILEKGVDHIHQHEWQLTQRMMKELNELPRVKQFGPDIGEDKTGIVTFAVEGMDGAALAHQLDQQYNIAVRAGYHCTPLAHETIGTTAQGAIRASVGIFTTENEVTYFVQSLKSILTD